jgi:hypothetical protein
MESFIPKEASRKKGATWNCCVQCSRPIFPIVSVLCFQILLKHRISKHTPEEQFIMATRSAEIVFVKIERAAVIEKSTFYTKC